MKDIAIYGAGGFGREVACLIRSINEAAPTWRLIGFFDDGKDKGSLTDYGPVLGGLAEVNTWPTELNLVICIGNPKTLAAIASKITNKNITFPNIIATDIVSYGPIEEKLGHGNVICTRCILSCDTHIGNFNIFNGYVALGHDSVMGDFNVVMPGTKLSGEIRVGSRNLFGANSFVLQGLKIGNGVTLTPCSALLRRPKDECTYVGNPATLMKL